MKPGRSPIATHLLEIVSELAKTRSLKRRCDKAGVHIDTVRRWQRRERDPRLSDAEALFNEVGLTLIAVPMDRRE
jgi:hypothetical protein